MEEERRRLEEERRRQQKERKKRLNKFVTKGNYLIEMASLLVKHHQNCPVRLLPAANELEKLIAEYVGAIVGTTVSAVGGAATTGILVAFAPFTFGITGAIAVGTGAATSSHCSRGRSGASEGTR